MKEITSRHRRGKFISKQAAIPSTTDPTHIPSRLGDHSKRRTAKRTVSRNLTFVAGGEGAGLELQPGAAPPQTSHSQDLAQLVWKYFENEIRSAMIEATESISAEKIKPREHVRR
jgi:hypothetical protein